MIFQIKKDKYYYPILIIIFLIGFLLRSPELISRNYLFGFDQGRDYLLVKEMVDNHKLRLIGPEVGAGSAGINGIFHGPGYLYLLSIFYLLFMGDPYGGVVMMFLFGIAALVIVFLVSRKILGKNQALLITYLVAIAPNIAPQSRFLWNHHPTSTFIPIVFYLVYKIYENPERYFPFALFAAGFIYNFELAVSVPLVIAVIFYTFLFLKQKKVRVYLYGFLALMFAFSPFLLFELRHDFIGFRGIASYFTKKGNPDMTTMWRILNIKDHFIDYWNNLRSSFIFDFIFKNLWMQITFFAITSYSFYKVLSRKEGKLTRKNSKETSFIYFLLILIGTTWIFFLLLKNTIWNYYLIHLHFAYIFLFVYTVFNLKINKKRQKVFMGLIIIFMIGMSISSLRRIYLNWTYDYQEYGGYAKIKGKTDAADFVYGDAKGEKFNVLVFDPAVYTYAFDYIFKWYGMRKYSYVPGKAKKGTFYLLIQPDPAKPWSYKGWQETVVKTGKVLWTKKLKSGLIVEKRIAR